MTFKCNQDHWPEVKPGLLGFGARPRRKIDGITEGKTYEGHIFPVVTGDKFGVSSKAEVLIFNDEEKWEYYQLNLFSPA